MRAVVAPRILQAVAVMCFPTSRLVDRGISAARLSTQENAGSCVSAAGRRRTIAGSFACLYVEGRTTSKKNRTKMGAALLVLTRTCEAFGVVLLQKACGPAV